MPSCAVHKRTVLHSYFVVQLSWPCDGTRLTANVRRVTKGEWCKRNAYATRDNGTFGPWALQYPYSDRFIPCAFSYRRGDSFQETLVEQPLGGSSCFCSSHARRFVFK